MSAKGCCVPARAAAPAAEDARHGAQGPRPGVAPAAHAGLIDLPGGTFLMGTDAPEGFPADGEGPVREVRVASFRIAAAAVTNAQFTEFVRATGHITQAEEAGSSFVFYLQVPPGPRALLRRYPTGLPWWLDVPDACWQRPEGAGSHIRDRMDHPVVHVTWHDAQAYCRWSGTRLPTEAEWEYAARGGLVQKRYAWGDTLGDQPPCNIFRGSFPNAPEPGWEPGTVPATSFSPNGFGLYNACGNVWEWCEDWFTPDDRRAQRGGSYLCHDSYCNRYRVAARGSNTPDSAAGNVGFRVAA